MEEQQAKELWGQLFQAPAADDGTRPVFIYQLDDDGLDMSALFGLRNSPIPLTPVVESEGTPAVEVFFNAEPNPSMPRVSRVDNLTMTITTMDDDVQEWTAPVPFVATGSTYEDLRVLVCDANLAQLGIDAESLGRLLYLAVRNHIELRECTWDELKEERANVGAFTRQMAMQIMHGDEAGFYEELRQHLHSFYPVALWPTKPGTVVNHDGTLVVMVNPHVVTDW